MRHRLAAKQLTHHLPTTWIPVTNTTAELPPYRGFMGQERAMRAVEVGLRVPTRGFNIFVSGDAGSGKTTTLERILTERAAREPVPPDVCYVHNFRFPDRPRPLLLPAGKGRKFAAEMERVVSELSRHVPRVLSDPAFGNIRAGILAETHSRSHEATRRASKAAIRLELRIEEDEQSVKVIPLDNGEPIDPEGFQRLPAARRRRIEANIVSFQEHLDNYINQRRQLEQDHAQRVHGAEVRAIAPLVKALLGEIMQRYKKYGNGVVEYLVEVEGHILENHRTFLPQELLGEEQPEKPETESEAEIAVVGPPDHRIYKVNVVVDRTGQSTAPVVLEQVPTVANLCGCFEYRPIRAAGDRPHHDPGRRAAPGERRLPPAPGGGPLHPGERLGLPEARAPPQEHPDRGGGGDDHRRGRPASPAR